MPKITIVTIILNDARQIEKTILSVLGQTYLNVEYIIIDGGSTDGTVDVIHRYDNRLVYWVSEPDGGLYDAMNKGIRQSSGDWIIFMNSGDAFFNAHVLSDIFSKNIYTADVLYGCTVFHYRDGYVLRRPRRLETINRALPFRHQSAFVGGGLQRSQLFNTRYRICADHDFFYHCFITGKKFQYLHQIVAIYDGYGLSANSCWEYQVWKESRMITGTTHGVPFFVIRAARNAKRLLRRCIPPKLLQRIRKRELENQRVPLDEIVLGER